MKRIIYLFLGAALCFTACQKDKNSLITNSMETEITDADFNDSKAMVFNSNKKKADYGLELDYDLVIKEVSENKYKAAIKVKGMTLNGVKLKEFGNSKRIYGVVMGLNTTKKDPDVPLDALLESTENSNNNNIKTFQFPAFEYKGDLTFEVIEANISFKLKDGDVIVKDKSTISIFGSDITVSGGNMEFGDNSSFKLPEGSSIVMNSEKTETNFAILLDGSTNRPSIQVTEDYFVLPNGKSVEQNPEAVKVRFPKKNDQAGYMVIVVAGDPNQEIETVTYKPIPVPNPNNPDDVKELPLITFHLTHYNQKNGIQRFVCDEEFANKDILSGQTDHFRLNGPGWNHIALVRGK